MSIAVVATIYPLPEHRDEVIAILEASIPRVHAEEGCELYALHEGKDRLVMVEKWTSVEALKVHGKGAALAESGPKLEGKLAAPTDVQVLQPHPAGMPELGIL